MRTRSVLLAALVTVIAALAGYWLSRRPAPELAAAVRPAAVDMPLETALLADDDEGAPDPSPTPRHFLLRSETIAEDLGFDAPKMRSIADATAADYRRRARYPRWSQPITDGVDPIERDREVTHDRSMGREGHDPTLVTYPARTSFEAPSPIVLYAYLVQRQRKVDARAISGEVRNQEGAILAAVSFHDDGMNGDAEANDLVFTAVLAPSRAEASDYKGPKLVEVRAETRGGELRTAATGFLYSFPLAHLTGRYRDELAEGNLRVLAEVLVDEASRFHLEATLAGPDGRPFAWTQNALALEPGTAWIPLTFYGLSFHDANVDGPYVLRSVALSTTGEMPNQKNDVVENAYRTAPYRVAQFSDKPFDDPDLLEAARRAQTDAGPSAIEAER